MLNDPGDSAIRQRILLLMLPPAGANAAAFAEHGLVETARESGFTGDIAALEPDLSLYLEGDIAASLQEIVAPALRRGDRIWLLGISMGGMGALLYAAAHAALVERIILLAPFIGTKGTIAGLAKAGGLLHALPDNSIATDMERKLLAWLREYISASGDKPVIHLGYGTEDRFAPAHRLLAEILPPENVVTLPGGHDWACWNALLAALLARHPAPRWTAST